MHLDSIFLMYVRAPFQTFLRFVDILSLIISNLPCARERALSNVPPSEQYSTLDYLTFLSFFSTILSASNFFFQIVALLIYLFITKVI